MPSTESSSQVVDIQSLSIIMQRAISDSKALVTVSIAVMEAHLQQELSSQMGTLREGLAARVDGQSGGVT